MASVILRLPALAAVVAASAPTARAGTAGRLPGRRDVPARLPGGPVERGKLLLRCGQLRPERLGRLGVAGDPVAGGLQGRRQRVRLAGQAGQLLLEGGRAGLLIGEVADSGLTVSGADAAVQSAAARTASAPRARLSVTAAMTAARRIRIRVVIIGWEIIALSPP
jgi:hypothetical protein